MSKRKAKDALDEVSKTGAFVRKDSSFREFVSKDHPTFKPESGRYHLFISYACPWANRVLAMLHIKGLEDHISFSTTHPTWKQTRPGHDEHCGWAFYDSEDPKRIVPTSPAGYGSFDISGCSIPQSDIVTIPPSLKDEIPSIRFVRDLYDVSMDGQPYDNKFTVPILWDKETNTIVNNESSELLRMLDSSFCDFASGEYKDYVFYPTDDSSESVALRQDIDFNNNWIYHDINNGVYKCGFARTQEAYDLALTSLYAALDRLEALLSTQRYTCKGTDGVSKITECDIRLFMTLVRFDEVYVVYFKTNRKRISDYKHIHNYCQEMYQSFNGKVAQSIRMDHIKTHYFTSHPVLNQYAVIPQGPEAIKGFEAPYEDLGLK